jgi:hypothetical protein
MKLNDAIEKPLNERNLPMIVRDWAGFKAQYAKLVQAKGQAAANQYAAQWLANMEGYKGVDKLKAEFAKQEIPIDKADEILFKVVDANYQQKVGAATQQKEKGADLAAKEAQAKGQQHEIEAKRIARNPAPARAPIINKAKPSGAPNQD